MNLFVDRIHRIPRIWSNQELKKFSHLFKGDVVNVSGWRDIDKEGLHYKDYFRNAKNYTITNFKADMRGYQGFKNEVFLDLESDLSPELNQRFDVVFNHTTLEHIYSVKKAFSNLCGMSKDIVIVVLPFLQPYHSTYGDYWRFTPLAIKRLFEDNQFTLLYQKFNNHRRSSVYIFSIASKVPEKWKHDFNWTYSHVDPQGNSPEPYTGCNAIPNTGYRLKLFIRSLFKRIKF